VDDDHRPGREVLGYLVEVGENDCCLPRIGAVGGRACGYVISIKPRIIIGIRLVGWVR
jgi:hypothetical protein